MSETLPATDLENQSPNTDADLSEIVAFAIGDQSFCLEIEHVVEIRGWAKSTILPHAPDYVVGLMNLRGHVLPVADLSMRLGLGPTAPTPRHVIIITQIDDRTIGLLVEAVSDILSVHEDDMKPTPDVASSKTRAFIKGVYTISDKLVRAIDVVQVFPREEGISV